MKGPPRCLSGRKDHLDCKKRDVIHSGSFTKSLDNDFSWILERFSVYGRIWPTKYPVVMSGFPCHFQGKNSVQRIFPVHRVLSVSLVNLPPDSGPRYSVTRSGQTEKHHRGTGLPCGFRMSGT